MSTRGIEVEGIAYRVIESMGFNHDIGMYAKMVATDYGDKVAVKHRGSGSAWRFWTPKDRLMARRRQAMWTEEAS